MTAPLRIGVLGCGAVACEQHLPGLRRAVGAVVAGLADPDAAARARASALAPGAELHGDAAGLLARGDVDAVLVAAPPALHAELAVAAAAAGKHVYVEKPLATNEDDAVHAVDAVAQSGVIAAMGFNRRRHPACEEARRLLEAGRIGEVRFVRTAFCEPGELPAWKRSRASGGGVLLDLASHHFDLVRWLLGAELEVVHARTRSVVSEQDEATTEIVTSTGVEVQSIFSLCAAHADSIELFGESGRLRIDRHGGSLALHLRRRRGYGIRRAWTASMAKAPVSRGDPSYGRALEAFVRRVSGEPVEVPSLEDGLAALHAVVAAERLAARIPAEAR